MYPEAGLSIPHDNVDAVCVCERENERESERASERER